MRKTMAGVMVAGAMAATLVLFGCGGQPASTETKTQETTTQETKTEEKAKTEEKTTREQTPAKTETTTETTTTTESTQAPAESSSTTEGKISLDEAKNIALTDAGVTEAEVTGLDAKLEIDDGVEKYDVDFKVGNIEHDYDINPVTGAIMAHTSEVDD